MTKIQGKSSSIFSMIKAENNNRHLRSCGYVRVGISDKTWGLNIQESTVNLSCKNN